MVKAMISWIFKIVFLLTLVSFGSCTDLDFGGIEDTGQQTTHQSSEIFHESAEADNKDLLVNDLE